MHTLFAALALAVVSADIDGGTGEIAVEAAPSDAGTEVAPSSPQALLGAQALSKEDVAPTLRIFQGGLVELTAGGQLQIQAALYTGAAALISNGDLASQPGFRVRRAGFGLAAKLGEHVGALLSINVLGTGPDVSVVGNVQLTWGIAHWLNLTAGTSRVPFSRAALASSSTMLALERPTAVNQITPTRRLGLSAEGQVFDGRLAYLAAVMNGTEGLSFGNQFGGILAGVRVVGTLLGRPTVGELNTQGLAVAASFAHDEGPGVRRDAVSGDVLAALLGITLQLEFLYDRSSPVAVPTVAPAALSTTERMGFYAEAGYTFELFNFAFQLTARGEYYDDNTRIQDAGDLVLVSGGLNMKLFKDYARAQLQYVFRKERFGIERPNDVLALSVQGAF